MADLLGPDDPPDPRDRKAVLAYIRAKRVNPDAPSTANPKNVLDFVRAQRAARTAAAQATFEPLTGRAPSMPGLAESAEAAAAPTPIVNQAPGGTVGRRNMTATAQQGQERMESELTELERRALADRSKALNFALGVGKGLGGFYSQTIGAVAPARWNEIALGALEEAAPSAGGADIAGRFAGNTLPYGPLYGGLAGMAARQPVGSVAQMIGKYYNSANFLPRTAANIALGVPLDVATGIVEANQMRGQKDPIRLWMEEKGIVKPETNATLYAIGRNLAFNAVGSPIFEAGRSVVDRFNLVGGLDKDFQAQAGQLRAVSALDPRRADIPGRPRRPPPPPPFGGDAPVSMEVQGFAGGGVASSDQAALIVETAPTITEGERMAQARIAANPDPIAEARSVNPLTDTDPAREAARTIEASQGPALPPSVYQGPERRTLLDRLPDTPASDIINRHRRATDLPPVPGAPPVRAAAPDWGPPIGIVRMPAHQIAADPARFQFKQLGASGVNSELKGVKVWNDALAGVVSVWRDPADGRVYVVNGHHRLDLAQRLGVPELNVRFIDAADAHEARAEGAYMNIAEGRGTATDVGKFLRDNGQGAEELVRRGVPLPGNLARDGLALSKLAPDLFDQVATEKMPQGWGVALGEMLPGDAVLQREALAAVRGSGKRLTNAEVREVARQVRDAGTEAVHQTTLLGEEVVQRGLFIHKAQLAASIKKKLATDKRLFGFVAKEGRAENLSRAGDTKIDVDAARELAEGSAMVEEIFDRLYTRSGPIADLMNAGARRIANGERTAAVLADIYDAVGDAVRAEAAVARGGAAHPRQHPSVEVSGNVADELAARDADEGRVADSQDPDQAGMFSPGREGPEPVTQWRVTVDPDGVPFSAARADDGRTPPLSMRWKFEFVDAPTKAEAMKLAAARARGGESLTLRSEPTGPEQTGMFGAREGTPAARTLAETEAAARSEMAALRQRLTLERVPRKQAILAARIVELEKLVRRAEPITAEDLRIRALAEKAPKPGEDAAPPPDPDQLGFLSPGRKRGPDLSSERGALGIPGGPGFTSRLSRAAKTAKVEKAPFQTWVNKLRGRESSADEFDWTFRGLSDEARKRVWTKAEMEAYTAEYGYGSLTEVVRGGAYQSQMDVNPIGTNAQGQAQWGVYGFDNDGAPVRSGTITRVESQMGGPQFLYQKGEGLERRIFGSLEAAQDYLSAQGGAPVKYAGYQEPGGTNYREVLVRTPHQLTEGFTVEEFGDIDGKTSWGVRFPDGRVVTGWRTRADAIASQRNQKGADTFRSGHWDEDNVLFHIRMNDRVGPNGEKVLHVEEIQSDWHQKGRKEGYHSGVEPNTGQHADSHPWRVGRNVYADRANAESAARSTSQAPDAPMKETPEWMGLAMKRVLDEAVAGGYDAVSWTPGIKQADRYSLRKVAEWVGYQPSTGKLLADDAAQNSVHRGTYTPEQLPDVIGKEATERLLEAPLDEKGFHNLTGEQLEIGGEGMKAFYDQMLPDWVRGYAKKLGVKLDIGDISTRAKGERGSATNTRRDDLIKAMIEQGTPDQRLIAEKFQEWRGRGLSIKDAVTQVGRRHGNDATWSILSEIEEGRWPKNLGVHFSGFAITPELRAAIGKGQTYGRVGGGTAMLGQMAAPGVGAVVGGGIGDTPEERQRNALLGAAAGAAVGFAGLVRAGRKIGGANLDEGLAALVGAGERARRDPRAGKIGAYHGTPYDFDRFSVSKIGTGEGEKAFGYGLYFAGRKETAKQYWENVSAQRRVHKVSVDGKPPVDIKAAMNDLSVFDAKERAMLSYILDIHPMPGKLKEALLKRAAHLEQLAGGYEGEFDNWARGGAETARRLADRITESPVTGGVYHVEIDADQHELLDWDKPFSEQSPYVQKILTEQFGWKPPTADVVDEAKAQLDDSWQRYLDQLRERQAVLDGKGTLKPLPDGYEVTFDRTARHGEQYAVLPPGQTHSKAFVGWHGTPELAVQAAQHRLALEEADRAVQVAAAENARAKRDLAELVNWEDQNKGSWIYRGSSGSMADVSDKFRRAGIKGIRYLDGGSRRSGEGTSNYVIFDDALINILKREQGFTKAPVLGGIAGAGTGALAGAATGDTPEERRDYAIAGALAGAGLGAGVGRLAERMGAPKGRAEEIKTLMGMGRDLADAIGVPLRQGRFNAARRKAVGVFYPHKEVTRVVRYDKLDTVAHEVGHYISKKWLRNPTMTSANFRGKALAPPPLPREAVRELVQMGKDLYGSRKPNGGYGEEGIAEWVSFYVTEPHTLQAKAPVFTQFMEALLEREPMLRDGLRQARDDFARYQAAPASQRIAAMIDTKPAAWSMPTVRRLKTLALDDLNEFREAVRDITDEGTLTPSQNAYVLARLTRGGPGAAEEMLDRGMIAYGTTKRVAPSVVQTLQSIPTQRLQAFREYLVAESALERWAQGIDPGISQADAAATAAAGKAEFEAAGEALWQHGQALIDYRVAGGLLTPEEGKLIKAKNQRRVGFYRVFDPEETASGGGFGKRFARNSSGLQRQTGSARPIIDPLESVLSDTYKTVAQVHKHEVLRTLVKLARQTEGSGRVIEEVPAPQVAQRIPAEKLQQQLADMGLVYMGMDEKTGQPFAVQLGGPGGYELQGLLTAFDDAVVPGPKESKDLVFPLIDKGKRTWYAVRDRALYDAIAGLGAHEMTMAERVLSAPTRTLRAGATLTPEFIGRNPVRDAWSASIYSHANFRPPGWRLGQGLFHYFKADDVYQRWRLSGGDNAAMLGIDRPTTHKAVRQLHATGLARGWDVVRHPIETLRMVSSISENATRLGEFAALERKALKGGASPRDAALGAALGSRNVTIDFARGGTAAKEINKIVAFFNANLQGTAQLARELKSRPGKVIPRAVAAITVPSVGLYLMQRDDPAYQDMPDWVKAVSWVYVQRGTDRGEGWDQYGTGKVEHVWVLPKPFELGVLFGTVPERIVEYLYTHDPDAVRAAERALVKAFTPPVMPTAAAPLIENWANKSFFLDRPVVPRSVEGRAPASQAKPTTGATARTIGGALDYAPAKVDNLIRGWTGGIGSYATSGLDAVIEAGRKAAGLPPLRPPTAYTGRDPLTRIPGAKAFTRPAPGLDAESVERVYRYYEQNERHRKEWRGLLAEGRTQEAGAYLAKYRAQIMSVATEEEMGEGKQGPLRQTYNEMQKLQTTRKEMDRRGMTTNRGNVVDAIRSTARAAAPYLAK